MRSFLSPGNISSNQPFFNLSSGIKAQGWPVGLIFIILNGTLCLSNHAAVASLVALLLPENITIVKPCASKVFAISITESLGKSNLILSGSKNVSQSILPFVLVASFLLSSIRASVPSRSNITTSFFISFNLSCCAYHKGFGSSE